jgi:hypothetical protein
LSIILIIIIIKSSTIYHRRHLSVYYRSHRFRGFYTALSAGFASSPPPAKGRLDLMGNKTNGVMYWKNAFNERLNLSFCGTKGFYHLPSGSRHLLNSACAASMASRVKTL